MSSPEAAGVRKRQKGVALKGIVFREGKHWVFYCPELDLSTGGESLDELLKNAHDAVSGFFLGCSDMGVLHNWLRELGGVQSRQGRVSYHLEFHFQELHTLRLKHA